VKRHGIGGLILLLALAGAACSAPARLLGALAKESDPRIAPTALAAVVTLPVPTVLPSATAALPEEALLVEKTVKENDLPGKFEIDAVFPYLGDPAGEANAFNEAMAAFEKTALEQFRRDAAGAASVPPDDSSSFFGTHYEVTHNAQGVLSLRLWVSFYMKGAAHPGSYSNTFTYDLRSAKLLTLADLFQPGADYLTRLANYCQAEITARDPAFSPEGAGPVLQNYRSWNLVDDGLQITFDEYQVAPYAAGPQSVTIPYSVLGDLIDSNGVIGRISPR
jgi:hypothetical protein